MANYVWVVGWYDKREGGCIRIYRTKQGAYKYLIKRINCHSNLDIKERNEYLSNLKIQFEKQDTEIFLDRIIGWAYKLKIIEEEIINES